MHTTKSQTIKILVVDDDEAILDAIAMILEMEEYNVATTTKGEQTYSRVDEFKPDLIILDVLMSGNDGRHICKKLKTSPSTSHIPIIMISAHPSAERGVKEAGADDFLPKPFDVAQLLSLVAKQVENQ